MDIAFKINFILILNSIKFNKQIRMMLYMKNLNILLKKMSN